MLPGTEAVSRPLWLTLRPAQGCTRLKSVFLFSLSKQWEVGLLDRVAVVFLVFFRKLHAFVPYWLPQGSSHQRPMRALPAPQLGPPRLALLRLCTDGPAGRHEGGRRQLMARGICFSLMTREVAHLSMRPRAVWVSPLAGEGRGRARRGSPSTRPWALGLSLLSRRRGSVRPGALTGFLTLDRPRLSVARWCTF